MYTTLIQCALEMKVVMNYFCSFPSVCDCLLLSCLQPFPKRQILDSSKFKQFADDNFRYDENGRKFFKCVENTVGKGEIAQLEQFLLFPQCFQKSYTADT